MIPLGWKFCPRCASEFQAQPRDGTVRPVCPVCGWVYFADPKVVAGVVVSRQEGSGLELLLGRRRYNPGKGRWYLPSGFVDYGEAASAAAARELLEETGLVVAGLTLLGVWAYELAEPNQHGIAIFYCGSIVGGTLAAADDVTEVGWFALAKLPDIAFDTHRAIITHWQASVSSMKDEE